MGAFYGAGASRCSRLCDRERQFCCIRHKTFLRALGDLTAPSVTSWSLEDQLVGQGQLVLPVVFKSQQGSDRHWEGRLFAGDELSQGWKVAFLFALQVGWIQGEWCCE